MLSLPSRRKRLTIAAFAIIALAVVVSPARATSPKPPAECPPGQSETISLRRELVVALAPGEVARVLAHAEHAREAVEIRVAETRQLANTVRLDVELVEAGLAAVERAYIDSGNDPRALVWLDRRDSPEVHSQREWRHLDFEPKRRASHPLAAGIDTLVSIARLPARAGLVVQHVAEAFAKVTPRVLRALL